ncbi:predicted protein [Postia placenta Mad-698-R]|nr:predicted protein [Postia placenta Mad-698-R]
MGTRAKAKVISSEESDKHHAQSDSEQSEQPLKRTNSVKSMKNKRPAHDDEEGESEEPSAKKKRVSRPKVRAQSTSKGAADDADQQIISVKANDEGDKYIDLGKKRRATVRAFKGTVFLDIREYYGQEGDEKPGKKGVTLNQEQWEKLKEGQDAIDALFKKTKK